MQSQNAQLITARFLGPTNFKGSRVVIESQYWKGFRKGEQKKFRKIIPLTHGGFNGAADSAEHWLKEKGFTILASGETWKEYWYVVKEFKSFAD